MSTADDVRAALIGSWEIHNYVATPIDGSPLIYPLGKDAKGIIMYTPDGYMSAQLMRPGVPKFVVGDLTDGTQSELAMAMKNYLAYSGRFEVKTVDGKAKLTHQMEVSLFPNWLANTQERLQKIEGEFLTLSTAGPILVQVSTPFSWFPFFGRRPGVVQYGISHMCIPML